MNVHESQKVGARQTLDAGLPASEPSSESREQLQTPTSASSPEPSFVMLRKLVEETDRKFIVAHEEVCVTLPLLSSSSSSVCCITWSKQVLELELESTLI